MGLENRVRKLEDRLGVREDRLPAPPIVVIRRPYDDANIPHFPEPIEQWETFRQRYRTGMLLMFQPDPFAEYELRHELEPGTLTEHPECAKVPFEELLQAVGCKVELQ